MDPTLLERLRTATGMATPPALALRLLRIDLGDESGVREFVDIAGLDPALASALLKFANARVAGRSVPVPTTADAVSRLGARPARVVALSSLVVAAERAEALASPTGLASVWKRAIARGVAARAFAGIVDPRRTAESQQAGVLTEIWRVALASIDPGVAAKLAWAEAQGQPELSSTELAILSESGPRASSALLRAWRMPRRIWSAIESLGKRPSPEHASIEATGETLPAILRAADDVAWLLARFESAAGQSHHTSDAGKWLIASPPASATALVSSERWVEVALAITQGWEQLRQLVSEVGAEACASARRQAGEALAEASMATQVENRLMKRRQDELMRRVATDALTGVKNRAAFDERLVEELERSQRSNKPLTLLMCDLDGFKMFNDRHGHQAGDLMLRAAASAILGAARRIDIVARYGGEEFAIVAPQCGFDGAAAMAERVRRAVRETSVEWHGQTLGLTVSVGAAVTGGGPLARTGDELIEAADRLLYRAKAAGRDRCIVEPGPVVTPAGASGPVTSVVQNAPASSEASRTTSALDSPR